MNRLLLLTEDAEHYRSELLARDLPELEICCPGDAAAIDALLPQVNILLGEPARVANVLPKAQRLQWVQSTFAGVEPLCRQGSRRDYTLTGVKDVFGPLMSEYVFGYMLSLERHLLATHEYQRQKQWHKLPYRSLAGMTMGICGLGSIGRHIATTAAHFGMRVVGLSRSGKPVPPVDAVYRPEQKLEFAQQLDYLVVVLPSTPATRHFINAEFIAHLPSQAVLINVGRGATVDQETLTTALQQQRLRGAVLDVFEEEPLPSTSALWELDNVVITPHSAALTFAADVIDIFCDNYSRFCSKKPLRFTIDLELGY